MDEDLAAEGSPAGIQRAYVRAGIENLRPELRELARTRLERWMRENGVRPSRRSYSCLRRLANPAHHCNSMACYGAGWPHVLDHPEWWLGPQGEFILTAHPYDVCKHGLQELARLQEEYGATVEVDPDGSWYYPGWTWLIVVRGQPPARPRAPRRSCASQFPHLTKDQALALARERGYLIARDSLADSPKVRAWWEACRREKRPFVQLVPRRTWASVDLDMDPSGRRLSEAQVARLRALFREYAGRRDSWWACGPRYARVTHVRPGAAEELARLICELARQDGLEETATRPETPG
jgi:hypothetical protein